MILTFYNDSSYDMIKLIIWFLKKWLLEQNGTKLWRNLYNQVLKYKYLHIKHKYSSNFDWLWNLDTSSPMHAPSTKSKFC